MEFLTLFASVFLFANHGTTDTWCLGCKFIMWQLVTAELSLSRLLLIAIREIVSRDTQPFVLKPEDLSVRAMVPLEFFSLGFSLAVLR